MYRLQCKLDPWEKDGVNKFARKNKLSVSALTRYGLHYLIAIYNGKFDKKTRDEVAFHARVKLSNN